MHLINVSAGNMKHAQSAHSECTVTLTVGYSSQLQKVGRILNMAGETRS